MGKSLGAAINIGGGSNLRVILSEGSANFFPKLQVDKFGEFDDQTERAAKKNHIDLKKNDARNILGITAYRDKVGLITAVDLFGDPLLEQLNKTSIVHGQDYKRAAWMIHELVESRHSAQLSSIRREILEALSDTREELVRTLSIDPFTDNDLTLRTMAVEAFLRRHERINSTHDVKLELLQKSYAALRPKGTLKIFEISTPFDRDTMLDLLVRSGFQREKIIFVEKGSPQFDTYISNFDLSGKPALSRSTDEEVVTDRDRISRVSGLNLQPYIVSAEK